MFDYVIFKHETEAALHHIGRKFASANQAETTMSAAQIRRRRGTNFVTSEVWQYRELAEGALIAEISYGWMMDKPVLGLTIFCVGALAGEAEEWDHTLSSCFGSIAELSERLEELHTGGRERMVALVEGA